ncbi:unnamed protein product [Rotaria magnacalcarata]|uniref:Transposase n=1 Tax=Rotaria magnacalcarata TaxID=392030 RepID=A0A816PXX8_9BILA|nr:unnamed protein product [Rotaria magnacalcarata]CAF2052957.1 unnamed protein product [Rotaria magnacalcarata]CAF2187338.1 unnamed protein product [Rotaria magnacalcarata]CAF3910349.1 unnamed protein product [Rotaria magnacalcarata]CAF4047967.1 unnamed protein product [Rotaria magnacalcarata]
MRKPAQIKQRLTFARDHQYWTTELNNVIWIDEAHFEVLSRKNGSLIRRLKSENNEPFNFVLRVQGGGGSVSVWECVCIRSNKYRLGFMQDNAPPHQSKFAMLNWPASSPDSSPDSNPIENLWDYFDKELRKLKPTNVRQLQTMIEDLWKSVTSQVKENGP